MIRRHFLFAAGVIGLVGLLGSCVSPTLPLPPPDEPSQIEQQLDGVWEIRGRCTAGAMVLVKNDRTGQIVGTEDQELSGGYRIAVQAELCDPAEVFEIVDDVVTQGTSFWIREVQGGVPQAETCGSGPP